MSLARIIEARINAYHREQARKALAADVAKRRSMNAGFRKNRAAQLSGERRAKFIEACGE